MWPTGNLTRILLEEYKEHQVLLKSHHDYRYIYADYGVGHFEDFEHLHSMDLRCRCTIKPINEEEEIMAPGIKKGVALDIEEVSNGFIVRPRHDARHCAPTEEQTLVFNTNDQLKAFIDEHYEEGAPEKEKKPRRTKTA